MKKIIALTLLAGTLAGTSAFGQGFFVLASAKSQAWDGFTTPGVSGVGATVNTAFLWAPASTTPAVDTLSSLANTPTPGNSTTAEASYTTQTAWTAILNGQFTLAVNSATSATIIQLTAANGSITYNGGISFGVTGTTVGTTYTIYEIGWSSAFATPAAAAAAGGAVGWSTPFQDTAVASNGTATAFTASKFGVFSPVVVPEPTTLALAGLSGASLLLFRRKK